MDVFSLALVTMYMYMKNHILVNMVTQGADNYNGYNVKDIQTFHLKLMVQVKSCDSCGSKLVQLFGVNLHYPPPPHLHKLFIFCGRGDRGYIMEIGPFVHPSAQMFVSVQDCIICDLTYKSSFSCHVCYALQNLFVVSLYPHNAIQTPRKFIPTQCNPNSSYMYATRSLGII